jgi:hypothetical protein
MSRTIVIVLFCSLWTRCALAQSGPQYLASGIYYSQEPSKACDLRLAQSQDHLTLYTSAPGSRGGRLDTQCQPSAYGLSLSWPWQSTYYVAADPNRSLYISRINGSCVERVGASRGSTTIRTIYFLGSPL